MINKQNVNRHFSKAAADYDRYACVQKKMAQRLFSSLCHFYKVFLQGLEEASYASLRIDIYAFRSW